MADAPFTYDAYRSLLERLSEYGYTWRNHADCIEPDDAILRHDIDYSPRKAYELARIEHEYGISATYFVLLTSPFYNVFDPAVRTVVEEIAALGHEIELHFDTRAHWETEPPADQLMDAVQSEQEVLEAVTGSSVSIVAFHNPPDWVLGQEFDAFVSTYEPRFLDEIAYVADSDQRWRETRPFEEPLPDRLQLLVHPVLWDHNDGSVTDRLRQERDYMTNRIERAMTAQNRCWEGVRGLGSDGTVTGSRE